MPSKSEFSIQQNQESSGSGNTENKTEGNTESIRQRNLQLFCIGLTTGTRKATNQEQRNEEQAQTGKPPIRIKHLSSGPAP